MERVAKIYFGNAAKFKKENFYELSGYTVTDSGEVYHLGQRIKEFTRFGYKYVKILINEKEKSCKVHRIVACTFTDVCGEFNEVVNHLDENKNNNSANNLQWTTNKENISWGSINEKRKQTISISREIREITKKLYKENNFIYHKGVKISRLKTCYKITDKKNGIILYTNGKNIEFNKKRGSVELFQQ